MFQRLDRHQLVMGLSISHLGVFFLPHTRIFSPLDPDLTVVLFSLFIFFPQPSSAAAPATGVEGSCRRPSRARGSSACPSRRHHPHHGPSLPRPQLLRLPSCRRCPRPGLTQPASSHTRPQPLPSRPATLSLALSLAMEIVGAPNPNPGGAAGLTAPMPATSNEPACHPQPSSKSGNGDHQSPKPQP